MIKNLSELQSNSKYASFAKRLTDTLCSHHIEPSPIAFISAFNKVHQGNVLKAHTARKWLLGASLPRKKSMMLLSHWLKVNLSDAQYSAEDTKTKIEIDFIDQEVISNYLSMNSKQKATVGLLIDAMLEKVK